MADQVIVELAAALGVGEQALGQLRMVRRHVALLHPVAAVVVEVRAPVLPVEQRGPTVRLGGR